MKKYDIIIIGAGAAGLIAAGEAAEKGAEVLLLEKMNIPGRKLFITGKGRCNLTNIAPPDDFLLHFGKNGKFLRQAFFAFPPEKLIEYFESKGVKTVVERGGRVFPRSQKSGDIVKALQRNVESKGVKLQNYSIVKNLVLNENGVAGVQLTASSNKAMGWKLIGDAVIIATGGKSYPQTGSSGDGYTLAESVGHRITPPLPALVPIETEEIIPMVLKGLKLRNVNATLWINDKKATEEFGELEFTDFGLTGPIVLTLSKRVVAALDESSKVEISIDMKPALDVKKLDLRLLRDIEKSSHDSFSILLKDLMPQKMIQYCIEQTGVPANKPGHQITGAERTRLRKWLKDMRFSISGHRPFREAIITCGGVETREINPRTMASRKIEGLYFAGEVIDFDADTGGYNLQAAFSTGWMAGRAAAEYVKGD
ncbi:MAG: NAD(P)/FAD-dependent oxidoreductase [Calditrichaeota bacterium]|nr:NAD(P)/FAD-dependent oxidoreductase [Calditrichota bacterium]